MVGILSWRRRKRSWSVRQVFGRCNLDHPSSVQLLESIFEKNEGPPVQTKEHGPTRLEPPSPGHHHYRRGGQSRRAYTLLQDVANATLWSATLWWNCVRCINHKLWCKKSLKKMQSVCDGGDIKHDSDFSCVCDAGRTIYPSELFMMRQNNINR